MFLTYSSLIGQGRVPGKGLATRIDQIIAWVGKYFEGLVRKFLVLGKFVIRLNLKV